MSNKLSLLVNFIGVDKMSGALRNIVGLGSKGSKSLRALAGDSRKLSRDLKSVQREIAKGAGNVTELIERERALESQLRQTNVQLDRQKRLAAIDADRSAMQRRGEELKGKGAANVMGGVAMSAPFILAIKAAGDFSSGMVDIQQKAELSDRATDQLANKILLLSAAAKQMPEDMRAGLDVLLGKGMNLDAATAAIGPAGRLSTAYKVELTDAADAAYASISNLKVASGQTAQIFDAMAAAGNAGGFEVKDMARHFPSLTAQMQALGEKGIPAVADLSAALQVAMNTAGGADEAGNNIMNLLGKINSPGTIAAFKKNFGVDLPAAMKKLTDEGHSSLEAIAMLTNKATGGDTKKLGFAFEDQQARMGVLALIQNMGTYRDIRKQAMQSGGTVDKAFSQRVARDATVQWRTFLGTASRLAIVLGTTLLPVATNVFGIVSQMVGRVDAWSQANPELAATLMQGAAALVALRIGLGVAQFALGTILGPTARIIALARQAAPVLGMLRTAAIFMGQGFLRAGAMMLANPIGLAIAAVVVAVGVAAYLIYTHWDKISAAFTKGVAWIKGALGGVGAWMSGIGRSIMDGLLFAIDPMALGKKLITMARNGITAFKNYLGIKSPSRVFIALGGHVAGGLERGIDGNRNGPARAAGRMAAGVLAAGSMAPAGAARRPGGNGAPPPTGDTYHFHIKQLPGEDAEALAEKVMEKMRKADERKRRRGFEDE